MFTDPVKNLKLLGLEETMIVADLGAGTGYYSIPAAKIVKNGKVYAIEVQKDFLKTIINKAHDAKLENLECIWGDVEKIGGTKIGDSIVDAAIVSNVFCLIEDKDKLLQEAKRILKNKGRVLIVEINEDSALVAKSKSICISKNNIRTLFEKEGFIHDKDIDAGHHHYGMIFIKQ
ncbi:MAG: class I SAM-dependent methyltransferase [Candidatus Nomurabacteria bacterium]|nr:class I SAM-dependent methyltransferase [Candidatus Nomurabacteria bacterium]